MERKRNDFNDIKFNVIYNFILKLFSVSIFINKKNYIKLILNLFKRWNIYYSIEFFFYILINDYR